MMGLYDRASSLFWLAFSIAVFIESLRLGIGTLQNPGMGFITLGASGILGILSLALFIKATVCKEISFSEHIFAGRLWKRVASVVIVLVLYAGVMPVAGYLIASFLLMMFLFWIVRGQRWWWVVVSSLSATVATYYVFSVWLNCQFPRGFFP